MMAPRETLDDRHDSTGFAASARIQCRRGELLVGDLDEGEEIMTASGRWATLTRVEPFTTRACVRVERDAFGPGQPHRAMSIASGQILAVEGRLVAAAALVEGRRVRAEQPGAARFVRLSLDRPGFVLVDGIAAELPQACGSARPGPRTRRRERLVELQPT